MHLRPEGRRQGAARVGEDTLAYAVGDIHGRDDLLARLLARIEADAAGRGARRRVVVFLGDYVDRGPDSREVMERLCQGPPAGFEWVLLRGNHEDFLLRFLDDPSVGLVWMLNGGTATAYSYLGRMPGEWDDMARLRDALRARIPSRHLEVLRRLALYHVEGDYLFVHAGVRPGVPLERQDPRDLMWIRDPFLTSAADHGKIVVHGHSVAAEPVVRPNRIGVDTGAFASGVLTAAALDGTEVRFLRAH